MYTHDYDIDEELRRLAPTDEEAQELRRAFAGVSHPLPDVDAEWARLKARMDEEGGVVAASPGTNRGRRAIIYIIGVAAAACVALALIVRHPAQPGSGDGGGRTGVESEVAQGVAGTSDSEAIVAERAAGRQAQPMAQPVTIVSETSRGEDRNVVLPDGSHVWLNAGSRLEYPSRFGGRRVVRLRGEGYFEVTHDTRHPFVVETEGFTTTVLGTVFNVRAYTSRNPAVVLVSGRVEVSTGGDTRPVMLSPGQKAEPGRDGGWRVEPENTYPYTQRKLGFFYFDHKPLHDIMAEIGRWYGKTVVFENTAKAGLRLHFVAERRERLSTVLDQLNSMDSVNVVLDRKEIVVR